MMQQKGNAPQMPMGVPTDPKDDKFKYEEVMESYSRAVLKELKRLHKEDRDSFYVWYANAYLDYKPDLLFTKECKQRLSAELNDHPVVKQFLWSVTKSILCDIELKGIYQHVVVNALVSGLCNKSTLNRHMRDEDDEDGIKYIILEETTQGFYHSEIETLNYMNANQWLLAYVLLMHYPHSAVFVLPNPTGSGGVDVGN